MTSKSETQKPSLNSNERDFIYDSEGFIQWCVDIHGKSVGTVKSYLSSMRTAFLTQFDLEMYDPFFDLKRTFSNLKRDNEASFEALEFEFKSLLGAKELVEKYGDTIITEDAEFLEAPTEMWLTALRTYLKYIRSKIDRSRQLAGLPIVITDDKELFLDLSLTKEFRQYLKSRGHGYTKSSIDTMCCKLRRLYNLFIRRRLKVDVMPDLQKYIDEGHSLKPFLQLLKSKIDYEKEGHIAPELSYDDFSRGKAAFSQYCDFIEDYSANPNKYSSI